MANLNNTRVKVPNLATPRADTDSCKSHDDLPSNPKGRDKTDYSACKRSNVISCRRVSIVSTMNVRTIREQRCREELVSNFVEHNIDVLGIQEHRIFHEEPVRYETILGSTLITTSATKNSAGASIGGVGVILNAHAKSAMSRVTSFSDRILIVNFCGNPATTIIVTYCPTNVADEDITEAHYNRLGRAIESIPTHNVLMVIGDFNARLGKEDARFTFHEETNKNGKFLMELVMEKNLICGNTYFQKRKGKLWTFVSPGGNKYQLDYILVRKKWKNSLKNVEAYNTFASVGSDHRIVSARMKLSLRKSKTMPGKKQPDWSLLCTDSDLQKQYSIEVRNRFEPLEIAEESATEKYDRFINANREAAEKVIPRKKRTRKTNISSDPRVITAREKIKKEYDTYQKDTSDENRSAYKAAKSNLQKAYNLVEGEMLTNQIKKVENAHANCKHGMSWKIINEITGRKSTVRGQLKGDTQQDRVRNWYDHFKNLLGSPPDIENEDEEITPILEELNIKVGPFDQEEYRRQKQHWLKERVAGKMAYHQKSYRDVT